jgi:hypothetical protein
MFHPPQRQRIGGRGMKAFVPDRTQQIEIGVASADEAQR